MATASSWIGQPALQALPSRSLSNKRGVERYSLPENLLVEDKSELNSVRGADKTAGGLPVLKVTKVSLNGTRLLIVNSIVSPVLASLKQTGKLQARRLAFTADRRNILVTTNRIKGLKHLFKAAKDGAKPKVISLEAVDRVQRGSTSHRFLLARQDAVVDGAFDVVKLIDEEDGPSCVSLVYRTHASLETLDLVVPNSIDFEVLLTTLEDLVALHHEERQRFCSSLQLLHHYWIDLDKPWESPLNASDFLSLCEKLQVPLKRAVLKIMFEQECAAQDSEDEKLSFAAVANLLENIKKSSLPKEILPLERLWQELTETDPVPAIGSEPATSKRMQSSTRRNNQSMSSSKDVNMSDDASLELNVRENEESISAVAFLSFLRSHQKEFSTSLEQATTIVHVLNQQAAPEDLTGRPSEGVLANMDRITKSRFIAFLTSDANDLMQPARGKPGSDDMTKPLSHYWINTSHDTYLASLPSSLHHGRSAFQKNKNFDSVDEQMYMAALLRGVRCLEIDIWDGMDGKEPVVAKHQPQQPSDRRFPLEVVLRIVRLFLQQHPYTFPIILKLENHCSLLVQHRLAELLRTYFDDDGLLVKPTADRDEDITLKSPESMRGKVVIMGKRPKKVVTGAKIRNDDFDAENDIYREEVKARDLKSYTNTTDDDDEEEEDESQMVIGFNARGPICVPLNENVERKSIAELLSQAREEARVAKVEAEEAKANAAQLEAEADEQETLAAQLTHSSGLSPGEVKRRANQSVDESNEFEKGGGVGEVYYAEEEKSAKDEGLEVHEVLPDFVASGRNRYEQLAREAMASATRETQCLNLLKKKEEALAMAKANMDMACEHEKSVVENAKKAATEARENFEHAEHAKERVNKVRELLRSSLDQSSSAGTVVQTALTEAKISEKRAAEAEARAARATAAAASERRRADEETRIEEALEQEVNDLHEKCLKATDSAKAARERVEKAAAMLDRVNRDIKVIENSSQYRKELQEAGAHAEEYASRNAESFLAKHKTKLEEQKTCRELIKEASEENSAAEMNRNRYQQSFEEKAYKWKLQADRASKARRAADRSVHTAEELTEHAEEEREAANLRHTARQRAEATVPNKEGYRSSLEAQLAEAERAAAEAAALAVQSRKRADHLAAESQKLKDHSRFGSKIEELEWEVREARGEYDAARLERTQKDRMMLEEKRRLDTTAEVCQTAAREAAAETDRVRVEHLTQEEAVTAYDRAILLRKQAKQALEHSKAASHKAEIKRLAAEKARDYKRKSDTLTEISPELAGLTLLHCSRFENWDKSLSLSNSHVHSMAQNVLLLRADKDPEEERRNIHSFTKNHLCRVFPSWKAIQNKSVTNYDPVFAWALGCQLVASNFHSADESLLVADGRFRQNGSTGYVLKPQYLRDNSSKYENEQKWGFEILSGHNLPRPTRKTAGAASPFVKISIYSGSAKATRVSYRTRPARHVGLNPVWSANNKFEFIVPTPSVSMICFSVWHAMDDGSENFMAASAFPASCLREGFRSISLFDANHSKGGEYMSSCLLVQACRK